ncbi:MAG: hypothetical protein RMJ98_10215 [Myxococcales bacterium]|nr:hypothetical protein [Polyangiaceae bacterium]MDW8249662.1 hypothetical protein [Myxococcales bacterium]
MMRSRYVLPLVSAMLAGAAMLAPSQAHAQQPPAPAPAAGGAAAGGTDHAQVSGTFGVGYLGLGGITIAGGLPDAGGNITRRNIDAPIIGVRYWLSESFGIDAGIGFGIESGKTTDKNAGTTTEVEKPSATGFLLHAGVPLVLGTPGQHHTFQVVPELNVGFGSSTIKFPSPPGGTAPPDLTLGGFRLDIGARAGTEIQFGFMGLPKLALQATVGIYFTTTNASAKQDQREFTDSNTRIGTTVQAPPWAIFTNNISALYYF